MLHRLHVRFLALLLAAAGLAALPLAAATARAPDDRLYPFLVAVRDYTMALIPRTAREIL
jgi:hypothetical protein